MEDWTPVEIRGWILKPLYELHIDDSQRWAWYKDEPSGEPEPLFGHIVRELKWLEYHGYVEIRNEHSKLVSVRLTPHGRDAIEQSQQELPEQEPRLEIGFSID